MSVPAFDLEHCLAQVEARGVTLLESTKTLEGWTQAKTKGIPKTMSIYERKNGASSFSPLLPLYALLCSPFAPFTILESSLITVRGEIDDIQAPVRSRRRCKFENQILPSNCLPVSPPQTLLTILLLPYGLVYRNIHK